jgi:DNA-binding LacI/PurR family transcriptional regulator
VATARLLAEIRGEDGGPPVVALPAELVVRESVGPPDGSGRA